MKKLVIPYITDLETADIESAADILEENGTKSAIDVLNWPDQYPYKPITYFFTGRSADAVFIKYSVKGSMLKAVYTEDHSPVHEDSCVEFFCMPEGADKYTNFEFNCIGTCSAYGGIPAAAGNVTEAKSLKDFFAAENLLTLRNTRIANLLGLPAISLPTGQPACGIMLMGRAGQDRALLTAAAGAEAALRG